jgi:hypothetical protein
VGIARAIIHSSDHPSVSAATEAIDRYVHDRNQQFMEDPKQAAKMISGKERTPPCVNRPTTASNNCKHPD